MINFWVPGVPQPGGSKKGFVNPKTQRVVIVEDCKGNKNWRSSVQGFAIVAYKGQPLTGPLKMTITFIFPRIRGHFGTGKNANILKSSAPKYHTIKPDTTKIIRSTEDAMTGIIWKDDAQVVEQRVRKIYGDNPGAHIVIEAL
jgi:Holliday junction resolvase RusA-like endonuclease